MLSLTRRRCLHQSFKLVAGRRPLMNTSSDQTSSTNNPASASYRRRHIRSFSEISSEKQKYQEHVLDKESLTRLMNYTFRPRQVPLGTMSDEQWERTLSGINAWLHNQDRNGYAIDSAERLNKRLIQEFIVMNPFSSLAKSRGEFLLQHQTTILNGWMEMMEAYPKSHLALMKADDAFHRLIDWQIYLSQIGSFDDESVIVPIQEFSILMKRWLELDSSSSEGCRRATQLLLKATNKENLHKISENSKETIEYFQSTMNTCLQTIGNESDRIEADIATSLMERMKSLSQQPGWEGIQIPSRAEKTLLEYSVRQTSISITSTETSSAIHDRIVELIQKCGNNLEQFSQSVGEMRGEVSSDAMTCALLTSFFANRRDPKRSYEWLVQLDDLSSAKGSPGREFLTGKRFRQVLGAIHQDAAFGEGPTVAEDVLFRMKNMNDPPSHWQQEITQSYEILLDIWRDSGGETAQERYEATFSACLQGNLLKSPSVLQSILRKAPPSIKQELVKSSLKIYAVSGKNFANAHMEALEVTIAAAGKVGAPATLLKKVLRKPQAISEELGRSAYDAATLISDNSAEDIANIKEIVELKNPALGDLY